MKIFFHFCFSPNRRENKNSRTLLAPAPSRRHRLPSQCRRLQARRPSRSPPLYAAARCAATPLSLHHFNVLLYLCSSSASPSAASAASPFAFALPAIASTASAFALPPTVELRLHHEHRLPPRARPFLTSSPPPHLLPTSPHPPTRALSPPPSLPSPLPSPCLLLQACLHLLRLLLGGEQRRASGVDAADVGRGEGILPAAYAGEGAALLGRPYENDAIVDQLQHEQGVEGSGVSELGHPVGGGEDISAEVSGDGELIGREAGGDEGGRKVQGSSGEVGLEISKPGGGGGRSRCRGGAGQGTRFRPRGRWTR